ncbi:MAG: dienelactone hydrolase family protein [Gemmatimonadetes bacterium]|nr:dienelactone hydrolase family protein [Gemmatimonadota bacterium]
MRLPLALACLMLLRPAVAASQTPASDEWLGRPVADRPFRTFLAFFSYSRDVAFETRTVGKEEAEGITVEHLSFQSTPGQRVSALLYQPPMPEARGVIILHGGTPAGKDGAYLKLFSTLIARAGFAVLAIDLQYFGERSTELLKTFTEQEKHQQLYNQPSTYLSWVAQTVKDAGRSQDFLVKERGLDPRRIGLVGISRGAQLGAIVAAADQRFAAVALLEGGHFDALETGHLPAACPANYIGRISPRPLFLLNAENDADYRKEISVLPLHRVARDPKHIRWTPGGHGSFTDEDRTALVTWLQANLK